MSERYAIYYVPDFNCDLYRFGTALLGRCVRSGQAMVRPELKGVPEVDLARHTKLASVYGFHGTIVAPFETTATETDLVSALLRIAQGNETFALNNLRLATVNKTFAAIIPQSMPKQLALLEHQCVEAFSPFRRPLNESDIARREPLTPKLRANLTHWGYHLVFDEFKFHLTVADSLPDKPDDFLAALESYLEPVLDAPLIFDRLALFYQSQQTEPFICRKVFLLRDIDNEH